MSRKTKILMVVSPILCIVLALGIRAVMRGRSGTAEEALRSNLRQIEEAKRQWDATNRSQPATNNMKAP
jgi:hypothetical protein